MDFIDFIDGFIMKLMSLSQDLDINTFAKCINRRSMYEWERIGERQAGEARGWREGGKRVSGVNGQRKIIYEGLIVHN